MYSSIYLENLISTSVIRNTISEIYRAKRLKKNESMLDENIITIEFWINEKSVFFEFFLSDCEEHNEIFCRINLLSFTPLDLMVYIKDLSKGINPFEEYPEIAEKIENFLGVIDIITSELPVLLWVAWDRHYENEPEGRELLKILERFEKSRDIRVLRDALAYLIYGECFIFINNKCLSEFEEMLRSFGETFTMRGKKYKVEMASKEMTNGKFFVFSYYPTTNVE